MKYQHFAIIFVIIILPISFVLSYYIKNQTDTLTLETQYQSKLNDSTYDAISAYQINSLNTQKVSGESVKSYVLASVNTFFTSLLTNLGMSSASRSTIQSYVPAILFTTYDGYYIYSPTKLSKVVNKSDDGTAVLTPEKEVVYEKNGNTETITEDEKNEISSDNDYSNSKMTTNPNDAKQEYNYMLKPFIYYSARYSNTEGANKYDFVASYALDNYLTLYGEKAEDKRN